MKQTVGLFAHVDAGKTTFAEQLLYISSSIGQAGRVDHQNAFMDRHVIEKERGITVFADQAILSWNGKTYDLIDTPGHVDFSSEMERALSVMDYAVVLISAVEGVEAHTETVWELLSKRHIPTLFFINKVDREGADIDKVLSAIQHQLTTQVIDLTNHFAAGSFLDTWTEEQVASLAEQDDEIMEKYIEGNYDLEQDTAYFRQRWIAKFQAGELFPCLSGSALSGAGVEMFLNMLEAVTKASTEGVPQVSSIYDQSEVEHQPQAKNPPFVGKVYKIRYDKQGLRYTYMKVLAGSLKVRDTISYHTPTENLNEKITKIVLVHGEELRSVQAVERGDLFAVCGLTALPAGAIVGDKQKNVSYELVPALRARVIILSEEHPRIVWTYFCRLNDEDPALQTSWYEKTGEIHIAVMGLIQLEVLIRVVFERFGIMIAFDNPEIIYKETISNSVFGYGHFEPLGHYAEVHLKLEPGEVGAGIVVQNDCHPDDLAVGYQNLVLQHLQEREHHGLLTSSSLTDVVITLVNGRAHVKHTSGGDFREATYRALRQGLEKVESTLLEPYYRLKIKTEVGHVGRVMQDITQAHGKFDPPDLSDTHAIITGIVPVSAWLDYGVKLASYSQGRATMSLKLAGYFSCHVQDEIIQRMAYRKDADPEYTSSSIFCAKGQGYSVPWEEAEEQMHAL